MPGVYVSYPFCSQKCTFCNFASGVFSADLKLRYQRALLSELKNCEWPWTAETLYLGGGTPSQIDPEFLDSVCALIPGKPWREATMEAAPGSLTPDRTLAWKRAGINRVSLGVQSFITRELSRTGRKHTAETVEHDISTLRCAGIENISLDLIAGLPGQTAESWRVSLDAVIRLGVPHVSVYMLEVDEDSRLGQEVLLNGKRYGAPEIPNDDAMASFYQTAVDRLNAAGVRRYEISNFARDGFASAHNLKYWKREPYLGFGSDAHSFAHGERWGNVENAAAYVECMEQGRSPRLAATIANEREEKFFVGLRLDEGVRPDPEDWNTYGTGLRRFLDDGLLEQHADRIRLTDRGVLLSNEVFEEFLLA